MMPSMSQDDVMMQNGDEEDICNICNEKRQDAWIACDICDLWFHYSCVGITTETAPKENEQYICPSCSKKGGEPKKFEELKENEFFDDE